MKDNYLPWQIDIDSFPNDGGIKEQFKFLINFAILAPSSHNSQPWRFGVKDNSISVFVEPKRRLIQSDKNNRQLYISLGCAIANIIIAADYYGFSSKIKYIPDSRNENLAAIISFEKTKSKSQDKNHLIFSIPKRATNRNRYENKMPPQELLSKLNSFSDSEIRIDVVSDEMQKNQLADVSINAAIFAMEDSGFREELSKYVKSNLTKSKVGMPGFGLGIPTPISLIAPKMIKHFNMNSINKKKDEALLKKYTPLFGIISTKEDNKINWLKSGEIYENIALLATQNNISTAPWAAPIQIGEFYRDFQKILRIDFRPQVFFRIGYGKKLTRHSPRIEVLGVI